MIIVRTGNVDNVRANGALIKMRALERLSHCQLSKYELELNNYCLQNYKASLKAICRRIVENCRVQFNQEDSFIVMPITQKWDTLASLITFGNSEVQGCNILKLLFYN